MPRPNAPWFRTSKGTWYARINGRMTSLGVQGKENRKAAYDAWHKRMSEASTPPTPAPVQDSPVTPPPSPSSPRWSGLA